MDWAKNLNLHLENFLPGSASLFLLALLYPLETSDLMTQPVFSKDFLLGSAFVSVAYVLGVVLVAVSRILDKFSEWLLRPWALRTLAIQKAAGTHCEINHGYRESIKSALASTSAEIRGEIARRRERIHLSRAALVPAILCVYLVTPRWNCALRLALAAVVAFLVLCVYTYLEVALYDEARLAEDGAVAAGTGATGVVSCS
jgi:hypothetical protein